jgi:hypothetical protein
MTTKALCNHPYVFNRPPSIGSDSKSKTPNRVQIGSTLVYKGKRCQIVAYQPPDTPIADCWPKGRPYKGLSNKGRVVKYRLDHPPKEGRYILATNRVNIYGEELSPQYFFARPKDLLPKEDL